MWCAGLVGGLQFYLATRQKGQKRKSVEDGDFLLDNHLLPLMVDSPKFALWPK
jgi:hypothetical protein